MSSTRKMIWIIGNLTLGIICFYAYLWGLFQAWGASQTFWVYPIGAVGIVLVIFVIFNYLFLTSMNIKQWGISVAILLGATGVTVLTHGILQNTIFE